jgi:hypothetical protein
MLSSEAKQSSANSSKSLFLVVEFEIHFYNVTDNCYKRNSIFSLPNK